MKRLIYLSLITLALTLSACNFAYAQSRTNRIYRPCPAATTPASVAISSVGAITLTPCSGQAITTTGTTLTTTTSGLATFNSPTMILGSNTLSRVDIGNAFANTVSIGDGTEVSFGTLRVGNLNYWAIPSANTLQLGASGGGFNARLDLARATSTATLNATLFSWNNATTGVTEWRLRRTVTAGGVTGNATINLMNGTVNFAAAATTITVTNSTVSATSQIIVTPQRLDGTCRTFVVDAKGAGTFNIVSTAACTAETSVAFWVTN